MRAGVNPAFPFYSSVFFLNRVKKIPNTFTKC